MATTYPTTSEVDAFVLSGFSSTEVYPASLASGIVIANGILPKFSSLSLGYLTIVNKSVRTESYSAPAGAYDPNVAAFDFENEDTSSLGENTSPGISLTTSDYTGPALIATGDHDAVFCSGGPSTCAQTLENTKTLFPKASTFGTGVAPDAGHCFHLHYSAQESFSMMHSWLNGIF
jgi:hypothetical protein